MLHWQNRQRRRPRLLFHDPIVNQLGWKYSRVFSQRNQKSLFSSTSGSRNRDGSLATISGMALFTAADLEISHQEWSIDRSVVVGAISQKSGQGDSGTLVHHLVQRANDPGLGMAVCQPAPADR